MKHTLARIVALAIAPALTLAACRGDMRGLDSGMDREVYVAVMGELADIRKFPPPATDDMDRDAQADSAREAILIAYGVTAPELLAFAQSAGSDPALMETLADQIAAITDSLAEARESVTADTAAIAADTIVETPAADSAWPDSATIPPKLRRDWATSMGNPAERPTR